LDGELSGASEWWIGGEILGEMEGVTGRAAESGYGTVSAMHNISTTTRRGRVIATGAFMLAACGQASQTSEALPSDKEVACDKTAVIAALSKPVTEATSVKYEFSYDPEGETPTPKIVEASRGENNEWSISYQGFEASSNGYLTEVANIKSGMYARLAEGVVEGVAKDEWVLLADSTVKGAEVLAASSEGLNMMIDDAIIGSESVADGVYQLGESIDLEEYKLTTAARVEGICEYKLSQDSSSTDFMNPDPVTARFDDDGRVLSVETNQGTTLTFGYEEQVIETPQKLSAVTPEVVMEKITELAMQDQLETAAASFDRQLRSTASFGDSENNNPNDTNPRKASLLVDMLSTGDAPAGLSVTVKGSGGNAVVAWDGEKLTTTLEKLDPKMLKVQISEGASAVCITVSAAANTASEVTGGACTW
jgi:hypothetical protein